jgi:hypothetical protein
VLLGPGILDSADCDYDVGIGAVLAAFDMAAECRCAAALNRRQLNYRRCNAS